MTLGELKEKLNQIPDSKNDYDVISEDYFDLGFVGIDDEYKEVGLEFIYE